MRLVLPLPDAINRWPKHPMALHRAKNAYRKACWIEAVRQAMPSAEPPGHVTVRATLYVRNRRDEDAATGCLKWVLDALKQEQTGKLGWRMGLYDSKGYLVDDDPGRCTVEKPRQVIDRKQPRLVLEIEPAGVVESAHTE